MCTSGNTQPAQGGIQGLLAKAPDPLHISNGGGGLDPLNLAGSPAPLPTAVTAGPELPPDPITGEDLDRIAYDQQTIQRRLQTMYGRQSTILTGPGGLGATKQPAGAGNSTAAAPTLLGMGLTPAPRPGI